MIFSLVSSPSSTPLNIRNLNVSLSAVQKHHVLFFSPVLGRLVVPFAVQTSIPFDSSEKESVGSVCNTHTKPWYPMVNEQLKDGSCVL